jgi:hypothetical protein
MTTPQENHDSAVSSNSKSDDPDKPTTTNEAVSKTNNKELNEKNPTKKQINNEEDDENTSSDTDQNPAPNEPNKSPKSTEKNIIHKYKKLWSHVAKGMERGNGIFFSFLTLLLINQK